MNKLKLVVLLLMLSGCALKVQTVYLEQPRTDRVTGELKPIIIEAIDDVRDFNLTPDGSGPRIAPKIAAQLGANGRSKTIAGVPMGGLVTQTSATNVSAYVLELMVASLRAKGYEVVEKSDTPDTTPRITIKINEFWCYMPFNFGRSLTWTNQMKAWIKVSVSVRDESRVREFAVEGYGAHIVQGYTTENIKQAYGIASDDFRKNLDSKLFTSF